MSVACRICGCTDEEPCVIGGLACSWWEPDLCSACAPVVDIDHQDRGFRLDPARGLWLPEGVQ